jgi:hypothetical protein
MTHQTINQTQNDYARRVLEAPVAEVPSVGNWLLVKQAVGLRASASELSVSISSSLIDRYYETDALVAQHKLSVYFMGYAPVFNGWYIHRGQQSDWAVVNLAQDTMFTTPRGFFGRKNRLIVPQKVAKDIEAIRAAGIKMDALFIAHEIPAGVVPDGSSPPLELIMPPPPRRAEERIRKYERIAEGAWQAGAAAVAGAAIAGAAAVAVTAATVAAGVSAVASSANLLPDGRAASSGSNAADLTSSAAPARPQAATSARALASESRARNFDPVLFGLQLDPQNRVNGMPMAMWYYLTHWYWE